MKASHSNPLYGRRRIFGLPLSTLSVILAMTSGLGLRLWMLKQYFLVNGDSLIYGEIAKNLLLHGSYATSLNGGAVQSTLIRLPGYPLFLALCFRLFGMENYFAATCIQIALELVGCLLLADFARRIAPVQRSRGAAHCTLWLATLCPFTAIYAVEPLTESLTLFFIALALWSVVRFQDRPEWGGALWFTLAVTGAALLRPDGAVLAVALVSALVVGLWRKESDQPTASSVSDLALKQSRVPHPFQRFFAEMGGRARLYLCAASIVPETNDNAGSTRQGPIMSCVVSHPSRQNKNAARVEHPIFHLQPVGNSGGELKKRNLLRIAVVCLLLALTPFAVWTGRNWRVFHVVSPLAPRSASDPGQPLHPGWQRWIKSWSLDFVSTFDVYWKVPGERLEISTLPSRAFDSPAQYAATAQLAAEYNTRMDLTQQLDARFGKLADERIHAHPLRSYLWLPLGRVADMTLRPRIENIYDDLDWWNASDQPAETRLSWALAAVNLFYLLLGLAGLLLRPRLWLAMLLYLLLRCALLATMEAPEARYTLEFFPILFAAGGIALYGISEQVHLNGQHSLRG